MRFLDRVDISGSVVMASTAKDQFTIGTPLENNDGNVDNLTVHANADFKNNVIIGSSAADTLNINATISGNVGNITASNIYLQNGTIYLNGQDVLSNMGGGGGNQQGGGSSNSTKYYTYSLVTSSTHYINANDTYDIYYTDPTSVSGNIYIYLPDASNNNVVNRMYHFKQIKDANYFTVINTVNNQTVDGAPSYSFTSVGGPSSTRSSLTVHAMMDTRDNSFKWFVFFYP